MQGFRGCGLRPSMSVFFLDHFSGSQSEGKFDFFFLRFRFSLPRPPKTAISIRSMLGAAFLPGETSNTSVFSGLSFGCPCPPHLR